MIKAATLRLLDATGIQGVKQLLANKIPFYNIPSRSKCFYDVLGLKTNASSSEIKEAYYKLSKMYHPDTNYGLDDATGKIQEINEAFEILGNGVTKKIYDAEHLINFNPEVNHAGKSYMYDMEPRFYNYEFKQEVMPKPIFKMEANNYYLNHRAHTEGIKKRKHRHFMQKLMYHRDNTSKFSAKIFAKNNVE